MKIGIIGTGAYAIALASFLENKNIHITMWTKLEEEYQELTEKHTNLKAIKYKLKDTITFTMNLQEICETSHAIIIAIPTKFIKNILLEIKNYIKNKPILIGSKGMIQDENMLLHDFIKKYLKNDKIACIAGGSFANDIIRKQPIGLTIGSNNKETLNLFTNLFKNISYLKIHTTSDILGIELLGILKNIIAIGTGILNGMNINSSTNAKFLTDIGIEIQKIIRKLGGDPDTFLTYAGLGDYILTCTNTKSRNYKFGTLIGKEEDYISYKENTTIEGLENLKPLYLLLKTKNIKSTIIDILFEIVYLGKPKELILSYLENGK